MSDNILISLFHPSQLERDRAIIFLRHHHDILRESKEIFMMTIGDVAGKNWNEIVGAELALAMLVKIDVESAKLVLSAVENPLIALLKHDEFRVRTATIELLGALCGALGIVVWDQVGDVVVGAIEEALLRCNLPDPTTYPDEHANRALTPAEIALGIRHDAEGWRTLENATKGLGRVIEAVGDQFVPRIDEEMLRLMKSIYAHSNRFVREAGFHCFAALVSIGDRAHVEKMAERFAEDLARGLSDNWSPVRYAAAVATRKFLEHAGPIGERYFALLLPPLCLNRHYVAEGVKLFSQSTWREVIGMRGRDLLVQYMRETVAYYLSAARAENHSIREAAFVCMGELALKVSPDAVRPHVSDMVRGIEIAFADASWPVRDMACLASTQFAVSFPAEFQPFAEAFFGIWRHHLSDHVWTVRENSGIGIATLAIAYEGVFRKRAFETLRESVPRGFAQPADEHISAATQHDPNQAGYKYGLVFDEAAKRARDNDPVLHTGQQTFSCCSLATSPDAAPHHHTDACSIWEESCGGVYLLRELCRWAALSSGGRLSSGAAPSSAAPGGPVPGEQQSNSIEGLIAGRGVGHCVLREEVLALKDSLVDLVRLLAKCDFAHHHVVKDTIFKELPLIMGALHAVIALYPEFSDVHHGDLFHGVDMSILVEQIYFSVVGANRMLANNAGFCFRELRRLYPHGDLQARTGLEPKVFETLATSRYTK